MNKPCPWYDMCIYKTATCRVRYPDNGCVLYRWFKELISKEDKNTEFHCGVEESGGHAYNCNDCPNKCEEWYQWDKEMTKAESEDKDANSQ